MVPYNVYKDMGMAGTKLCSNSLGARQSGSIQRCVWSVLRCYTFGSLVAQPCSQTMLLLPNGQSDVYFLLIVSNECC
jgi:hypothetical protein